MAKLRTLTCIKVLQYVNLFIFHLPLSLPTLFQLCPIFFARTAKPPKAAPLNVNLASVDWIIMIL